MLKDSVRRVKLVKLGLVTLATALLVSCSYTPKNRVKVSDEVLFNNLKPYIGVFSGNTLEDVLSDVYYNYKLVILAQQPSIARKMKFEQEPIFTNARIRLLDEGLVGSFNYKTDTIHTGKVTIHHYYFITYNFFTGETFSNLDSTRTSRLIYDKFRIDPVTQLEYLNVLKKYTDAQEQ